MVVFLNILWLSISTCCISILLSTYGINLIALKMCYLWLYLYIYCASRLLILQADRYLPILSFHDIAAFLSQMVFMVAAGYVMTPVAAIVCLTIAVGLGGFAWGGFSVNHLDIAPQVTACYHHSL